jgi:hypothetical protein
MDDDDYGYGRSLGLLRMLIEYSQSLVFPIAVAIVVSPIVLYLVARSRAKLDPFPDQQLGLKFAIGYFKSIAFHASLVGGVVIVFAILMKGSEKSPVYRTGFGIFIPAIGVYLVHLIGLTRTNQGEHPMVGRLLAGWSLLVSGIIGFVALMLVSQTVFQKGSSGETGRLAWALFLIYGSAWVVQAARFFRATTSPLGALTEELPYYPPPPGAQVPGAPPPVVPSYAAPHSPFAPPPPAGDAAYLPPGAAAVIAPPPPPASVGAPPAPPPEPLPFPPGSPFAPVASNAAAVPTVTGPSPFAPPASGPVAVPTPMPAPAPAPPPVPEHSPFAPPGLRGNAPAAPYGGTGSGGVPVPAPMAKPLAPPRGDGSGSGGSGKP